MDIPSYMLGKKAGSGEAPILQDKEVTVTENGNTSISSDAGYTAIRRVDLTTNVQPNLESKSVTINTNTTTTITPTSGKDGLSSVEVTTNIAGNKFAFINGGEIKIGDTQANTRTDLQNELTNIIENVDTSSITNLTSMFANCTGVTSLDFTGFDTSNCTTINGLLAGCSSLTSVDLSTFNTTNCNNISYLFQGCTSLPSIDLSNFDTSNVTTMAYMFYNCSNITTINLSSFTNTSAVNLQYMFYGCKKASLIDMRSFDFTKLSSSNTNRMFGLNQDSIPKSCTFVCANSTQKQWLNNTFGNVAIWKTVAEYEGN